MKNRKPRFYIEHFIKPERIWLTKAGYWACVALNPIGFRVGYVAFSKRLLNAKMNDYWHANNFISVHGGITFSYRSGCGFYWVYGFDCGHFSDAFDPDSEAGKILKDFEYEYLPAQTFKSLEYCVNECEHLARQLKRFKHLSYRRQKKALEEFCTCF